MNRLQNRRNKKRFTELLEELLCKKSCDLQNALFLMSKNKSSKSKAVSLAAQNIYDSLRHGDSFSIALRNCPFISFDVLYISFINFAERCGELEKTIAFLNKKCCREEENHSRVVQASVYPAFVVVVSVVSTIALLTYFSALVNLESSGFDFSQELFSSFYI